MKFKIKIISSIILILLILVCGYQTYWLINFHNQEYNKTDAIIKNTIDDSAFKEIATRWEILALEKQEGKFIEPHLEITDGQTIDINQDQASFNAATTIDSTQQENSNPFMMGVEYMTATMKKGISTTMNIIRPVDIVKYDSIFTSDLKALNINIPHIIERREKSTETSIIVSPINTGDIEKSQYKEYPMDMLEGKQYTYALYMENPKWYVFKNMWGLVSISVLMVIMLIISYIYLLRTILKQKTIDEIKSDFINNMTHELKTPISVTYAAVDTLQNFGVVDEPEKRDKYLTISKEQLMYLNSLVEQILTMSVEERKNLRLNMEEIIIKNIFENHKNQFLVNAVKPIQFTIDVQPENIVIEADKLHFGNIISNLIENAVKYSGENVEIKLSARHSNNKTIISVCDNGIGIPHGAIDKIFDKFYRVSTGNIHNVKGYGLGLFYVKTIIDKHNWEISVESKEGKGSCFKIIIS